MNKILSYKIGGSHGTSITRVWADQTELIALSKTIQALATALRIEIKPVDLPLSTVIADQVDLVALARQLNQIEKKLGEKPTRGLRDPDHFIIAQIDDFITLNARVQELEKHPKVPKMQMVK